MSKPNFLGLRFDNHVSFGHIMTTITILIAGVVWVSNAENRLLALEKFDTQLEKRIESERDERKGDMNEIKYLLKEIRDDLKGKADKP